MDFIEESAVIGTKNVRISAFYPISEVMSTASRVNTGSEIAENVLIFKHFLDNNTLFV